MDPSEEWELLKRQLLCEAFILRNFSNILRNRVLWRKVANIEIIIIIITIISQVYEIKVIHIINVVRSKVIDYHVQKIICDFINNENKKSCSGSKKY